MAITLNDNGYNIRLQVPLTTLLASSSMIGIAQPLLIPQRSQQGLTNLLLSSLPAGTSTLVTFDLPAIPYQIGNAGNNAPRGFQLTDVTMLLTISSGSVNSSANASTTSFTAWLFNASDGATATTAPVAYGGSSSQWTYNEGSSVGASWGNISAASTFAQLVAVPAAGLNPIINTDNQRLMFELYMTEGATTSTFTLGIWDITIHGKLILGG